MSNTRKEFATAKSPEDDPERNKLADTGVGMDRETLERIIDRIKYYGPIQTG
jgi:hypothetical protein